MSAIEPPSLWPTSSGSGASSWASRAGRTSSASSWKNAGVRGRRGGSELPWPKREKASTRRPVASAGLREVAPQPDRAEPLVQEHERAASAIAGEVVYLDREPVDRGHGAAA